MQLRSIVWSPLCSGAAVGVFLSVLLAPWSRAESITTSWDFLPEESIVAVRIPAGQRFATALVGNTKLGAVLLGEKKRSEVAKVLRSDGMTAWAPFQELLDEYGLTTGDLVGLLAGESGYAVAMAQARQSAEDAPVFSGLGWLEPGEALASRVVEAIARLIDEQDEEQPITRIDLTLADQPVMQLRVPAMEMEYQNEFDVGDAYDELPAGEKRAAWEKAYQEWHASAVERVVYRSVLICALHDRLLIAHNYQADTEDASLVAAEQLSALFAEWIAAHATGVEGFVTRLAKDVGAERVMALDGLPAFELLGDVTPWVALLRASAPTEEKAEQLVRILGLDGLGAFAMRSTLQGTQWSTRVSLAAPTPRQGLLQLLDQEPLAIDPSQWVPANAVCYYQFSFDLGTAYEIMKAEAMREFPEQLAGGITMAETYVQNFAQASLSEVLSSLGNRHTIMSFGFEPGRSAPDDDTDFDDDGDTDDDDDGEADHSVASERFACVWQVEDEALWSRLFKAIAPFAGMAPGAELTEEQGFSGWRMKREANEGGLFLGKGYLVLGIGSGVIESILSSLNNPPVGTDALRGGDVFTSANAMIDLEPALAVEITDGNRYLRMLIDVLEEQFQLIASLLEEVDPEDDDEEDVRKLMLPLVRAILPSHDESNGMMGVMVSRWEVNDDGVFGESVQELPAP